jgi:hypothetical protein
MIEKLGVGAYGDVWKVIEPNQGYFNNKKI